MRCIRKPDRLMACLGLPARRSTRSIDKRLKNKQLPTQVEMISHWEKRMLGGN